jgi:serine protease
MRTTHLRRHPLQAASLSFLLLLAGLATAAGSARAASYVPGQVIVGYRSAVVATADAMRIGVRHASAAPAPNSRVLHLPPGESVATAIARLRRQPGVAYAEPNFIAHTTGSVAADDPLRAVGTHAWQSMQWNLMPSTGVNAPQAWSNLIADHRAGGRGVIVAVLDTGVAYRNWNQFYESPDFAQTRFVSPYDFVANNRYPLDRNGHGTFVAGIIAESTNNGIGLSGIAYGASIMPVRVLDASGEGDETTIATGIRYAVTHGAQVINLSLEFLPSQVTSGSEIPQIVSAINFAHRRGVTVVGAAGNDESNQVAYPARARGVISVGATTKDDCLADYSNGGSGLDLVAPGGGDDAIMQDDANCHPERNLPSIFQLTLTDPPHWDHFGFPNYYIGTSMSSPQVAAAAALVIASHVIGRHPTPDQVLTRLEESATELGAGKPNTNYGYGLVNVGAATRRGPVPPGTGLTPPTTGTTAPTTPTTPPTTTSANSTGSPTAP